MTKSIQQRIDDGTLPIYPTTYAQGVVDHAAQRGKRGKNPSMPFLDEQNPRKALDLAKATLEEPEGIIRDRLRQLRQHLPGQQQIIYDFAKHLADYTNAELVPQGFVLAAALALYDLKTGINGFTGKPVDSPLVGRQEALYWIIELSIPLIAKAIFPDDFASEVKETVRNVHDIMQKDWEAAKAAAPKPTIEGDPLTIYTAARRIADLSFEFYQDLGKGFDRHALEDRRTEEANPFYSQTTGGLFLELYYSGPGHIWTPWGKWGCWGCSCSRGNKDPMEDFLAAIGEVELFAPEQYIARQGVYGPVYAIKRVGDIELPAPQLREKVSYFEYEDAKRQWAELTAQYNDQ